MKVWAYDGRIHREAWETIHDLRVEERLSEIMGELIAKGMSVRDAELLMIQDVMTAACIWILDAKDKKEPA